MVSSELDQPELFKKLSGHNEGVNSVSLNSSTLQVISSANDKKLWLWNLKKKDVRPTKLDGHSAAITEVAFAPSGSHMATASLDKTVRIWSNSLAEGYPSVALRSHNACVRTVDFSPDSKFLLSGSDDKSIKLFNAFTKKFVRSFTGHRNWVSSVRFSPDNEALASGGHDRYLKLWNIETAKVLAEYSDHKGVINAVRYLPDNKCVASCSQDNTIKIYDIRSSQLLQNYVGHNAAINSIAFHPSGYYMVSTANDSKVKIWDLRQGKALYTLYAHEGQVNTCDFSFCGDYCVTAGSDRTLNVWRCNFIKSGGEEFNLLTEKNKVLERGSNYDSMLNSDLLAKNTNNDSANHYPTSKEQVHQVFDTSMYHSNEMITSMPQKAPGTIPEEIAVDSKVESTLDKLNTQLGLICDTLKNMETRITGNEQEEIEYHEEVVELNQAPIGSLNGEEKKSAPVAHQWN